VHNQARHFGGLRSDHRHIQVWHKLKATNLDQAYPILASLYAADEGASRVPDGLYVALMAMLEYGDFSTPPRYERTLQQLFFTCFVAPSADKGLIDLQQLFMARDGSKLPTWVNPHSHKLCLRETRTAGRERWFFRRILAAMCQHIDAWLIHAAHRIH